MTLIELNNLSRNLGGLRALDDVNLNVESLEIRALVGPNGARSSTLLNTISGYYKPISGRVIFQREDITGLTADQVAAKGFPTFSKKYLISGYDSH
jgi:branched-chain amino acid transport system ATP-binding protein